MMTPKKSFMTPHMKEKRPVKGGNPQGTLFFSGKRRVGTEYNNKHNNTQNAKHLV
jgi:hypothetical protein